MRETRAGSPLLVELNFFDCEPAKSFGCARHGAMRFVFIGKYLVTNSGINRRSDKCEFIWVFYFWRKTVWRWSLLVIADRVRLRQLLAEISTRFIIRISDISIPTLTASISAQKSYFARSLNFVIKKKIAS